MCVSEGGVFPVSFYLLLDLSINSNRFVGKLYQEKKYFNLQICSFQV